MLSKLYAGFQARKSHFSLERTATQNFTSGATMRNLSASILFFLLLAAPLAWSQTATISSSSGPVSWDFAAVVGGTVTNVGIQDMCPPAMCDNHDLTVVLPAPAASFYQTMTAKLTIKYTWSSTAPADLDIFAISPNAADHGPGS